MARFDNEKDHSFKDTVLRETEEELGIDKNKIEILGQFNTLGSSYGNADLYFYRNTEYQLG